MDITKIFAASVQNDQSHNFYFYSYFSGVGVYKIEDCVVEGGEEGNAAVVLIFI